MSENLQAALERAMLADARDARLAAWYASLPRVAALARPAKA